MKKTVLLDTSAVLAALDGDDRNHRAAVEVIDRIAADRLPCFITQFIEFEAHAVLLARMGRRTARDWLNEHGLPVISASPTDVLRAKELINQYDDKDWSLCDAVSFVVAEKRKAIAFSFDHHFLQYAKISVWGVKR